MTDRAEPDADESDMNSGPSEYEVMSPEPRSPSMTITERWGELTDDTSEPDEPFSPTQPIVPMKPPEPISPTQPIKPPTQMHGYKNFEAELVDDSAEDTIRMQQALAVDVIMPRALIELEHIFYIATIQSTTLAGLRTYIQRERQLNVSESKFHSTVKNLLDHGIQPDYLLNAIDAHANYTDDYKQLYKAWIQTSFLRAGYGHALLGGDIAQTVCVNYKKMWIEKNIYIYIYIYICIYIYIYAHGNVNNKS